MILSLLAGGVWRKVAEINVTSDATQVNFTSLDLDTTKSYMLITRLKNTTASTSVLYLCVNGDTTLTNYYSQELYNVGTGVYTQNFNDPRYVAALSGESSTNVTYLFLAPDGIFRYVSHWSYQTNTSLRAFLMIGNKSASVGSITELNIVSSVTGGISAGSEFILLETKLI